MLVQGEYPNDTTLLTAYMRVSDIRIVSGEDGQITLRGGGRGMEIYKRNEVPIRFGRGSETPTTTWREE